MAHGSSMWLIVPFGVSDRAALTGY